MVLGLTAILILVFSNLFSAHKKMTEQENCLWSFGYGSNMDVKALESKKDVEVLGK
jgi:hypothetical protein